MSDLAVSLTKSVVVGAVSKALAAIEEEAKLRRTVKKDMEFIAAEFEMMQSFLSVADEEGVRNKVMRTWVSQVRDLAYDLEDTIEYVIDLDETPDWHCRCLPGFIRPDLPLDKAVHEIKLFKDRVQEVGHRNMRYNLISDSGSKPVTQQQLVPGGASVGATRVAMLNKASDATKMQRGLGDLTKLLITHMLANLEGPECSSLQRGINIHRPTTVAVHPHNQAVGMQIFKEEARDH